MSALGERAAKAQTGIADLESALEHTQKVLAAAEKVDAAATQARTRSRTLVKLLVAVTVIGVAVLVARKVMAGSGSAPADTDPYGSTSTDD